MSWLLAVLIALIYVWVSRASSTAQNRESQKRELVSCPLCGTAGIRADYLQRHINGVGHPRWVCPKSASRKPALPTNTPIHIPFRELEDPPTTIKHAPPHTADKNDHVARAKRDQGQGTEDERLGLKPNAIHRTKAEVKQIVDGFYKDRARRTVRLSPAKIVGQRGNSSDSWRTLPSEPYERYWTTPNTRFWRRR